MILDFRLKKAIPLFFGIFFSTLISAQTFFGGSGPINDVSTNDFPVLVSGLIPANIDTNVFGLETVCVNLTHTYDSDLQIEIIAPDGTMAMLSNENGGGNDDYTNTCFDYSSAIPISQGSAPFTGTFIPQGEMGRVNNGQVGNGTWILRVIDVAAQDFGNLISWSITFGNNPATYFSLASSNLPIVIINTNNVSIPDEPKIPATMGIIYNGIGNRNHINDPWNNYNGNVGIEMRGNYSASLPQKPYDFETRDSLGNPLNVPLIGMPSENDWSLIALYNDKSFMRNMLAYYLFEQMGHWGPRSQLCEVILNGEYQGLYALTESIKRDSNRVDIAKLDSTELTWPSSSGGYILKTDYWDNTNSWLLNYSPIDHPGLDVHMVYYYPRYYDIQPAQKNYIQTFINDYETALYGPNFADPITGYRKYLSTRSFIDYFFVNELSRNTDGFKKIVYFNKDKDNPNGTYSKLKAGPVWDFDWAWKDIWDCSIFQATDGSGWSYHINDCSPDINGTGWYVRLLQDSTFADELNCRWQELRGTILDTVSLYHWIDSVANYANEAQQRHFQYWGILGVATGTPEVEPPSQSYAEEIFKLKAFITRRIVWMDANMPGNSANCNLSGINNSSTDFSSANVYPNPFNREINFSLVLAQPAEIQIELLDALGQPVQPIEKLQHNGGGTQTFSFTPDANLAAGIYLLKIKCGDKYWTREISKVD